LKPCQIKKFI
jgi:hypothetical protein